MALVRMPLMWENTAKNNRSHEDDDLRKDNLSEDLKNIQKF